MKAEPITVKLLLRWAWPFFGFCLLFDAYSYQLFFNSLAGEGFEGNVMFSLGILAGDLPSIIIVGVVLTGLFWLLYRIQITVRSVVVSLGIGCLASAIIIRPILIHRDSNNAIASSATSQPETQNPEIAALQKYYPDQYAQVLEANKSNADPIAVQNIVEPIVRKIILGHKNQIDDAGAVQFYSLVIAESKVLISSDPVTCINLLNGNSSPVPLSTDLSPTLLSEDQQVSTALIVQIANQPAAPAPTLTNAQENAIAVSAMSALPTAEQTLVMSVVSKSIQPSTVDENHAVCDFDINMFQQAVSAQNGTLRSFVATN
jgi:hypothetical protein